jgi:argininosuccinate synthase
MRNLDIADSRTKLEQYAAIGLVGGPALAGLAQQSPTRLIGPLRAGGAEAIASRGAATPDDGILDHVAMESGTD